MTPSTTLEQASGPAASKGITDSRRSLDLKRHDRRELMRALHGDELGLQLHQIKLESYKPAMDAMKLYLEIHGSSSPNFYMTRNKQVAAACQMSGINDPDATRIQLLAATTCYEKIYESIVRCLDLGLSKEATKKTLNEEIEKVAEFFGLGNKKAVKGKGKKK